MPHFFVGDMRRIWNMYYTAKTPLVECIETSTGGHSHTPHVSSVKKYSEYVHIVKSNLGLRTDGISPDVTVYSDFMHERAFSILLQISGSLPPYTSMQDSR